MNYISTNFLSKITNKYAIVSAIICVWASAFTNAATYTTTSKTNIIAAGTYGGDVDVGISDSYGITDGIRTTVNVDVLRTSSNKASGVYFNSASGIGSILAASVKAKAMSSSAIVYGLRFQNSSQTTGKQVISNVVINSGFQARGALYLYGTSSCGNISGTYEAHTTSTNTAAYAASVILNSTSTCGSFNNTTIVATGANAYGISSNRSKTDTFNFTGGNSISASGAIGSFILFSSRDMVLTGDSNINTLSSTLSNAELYASNGINFSTGVYKFTQATALDTDSSAVTLSNGSRIILSSEASKLTLLDSSMTIKKGFEMDIILSRDRLWRKLLRCLGRNYCAKRL